MEKPYATNAHNNMTKLKVINFIQIKKKNSNVLIQKNPEKLIKKIIKNKIECKSLKSVSLLFINKYFFNKTQPFYSTSKWNKKH